MLTQTTRTTRPGFSLVELLVVIAIIALVIAIILPALGGARVAARRASTAQLLTTVGEAVEQFSQDNSGRMPGYFSPRDMGAIHNTQGRPNLGGFTAMENALLELIAADAIIGEDSFTGGGPPSGVVVGPRPIGGKAAPPNVIIDPQLIGTGGSYLAMDAKSLRPASGQNGSKAHAEVFPDVVDAFGNPVLAWVEDPMAPRTPADEEEFAAESSKGLQARYYWTSNAAWLTSTAMGDGGKDQTSGSTGSLLTDPDKAKFTLTAVLGNPSFPVPVDYAKNDVLPGATRGGFVIHSAGPDGVFFGADDPGARAVRDPSAEPLEYWMHFFVGSNRLTDEDGLETTIDLARGFDDLMTSTGN